MILRRFMQHVKEQNWFAVGLDVIVVIVGIFLGMQVTEWNEERNFRVEEKLVLQRLQHDLHIDVTTIRDEIDRKQSWIQDYIYCLDILSGRKEATKSEFNRKFETILLQRYVAQNRTTFNDLQTSGQFILIQNNDISNAIVDYYHNNIEQWFTADREYTRNIIAPFLLKFDYSPTPAVERAGAIEGFSKELEAIRLNTDVYELPEKDLTDYKNSYFVINILRNKIYTLEGQVLLLEQAVLEADELNNKITEYIKTGL